MDPTARLTATQLAHAVGVTRHTVAGWVRLGHLKPVDRAGRSPRYLLGDGQRAERATRTSGYSHRTVAA